MPLGVLLHTGMSVRLAGLCNEICLVCFNYCGIRGSSFYYLYRLPITYSQMTSTSHDVTAVQHALLRQRLYSLCISAHLLLLLLLKKRRSITKLPNILMKQESSGLISGGDF